ncbi:MAG: 4-hydroxy-3-methylbut-2-enyl diphosphate reductase [Rhodospirillaceae bacterium TMED8]|nr:4-hydroxy-3-methylbut-2-enyl diphosphate reductase [Magnetovibrio sp.]OUT50256.1 MAG: 4-hydroxy-3-methylbut-2-enyl diphosphate reductase [Rhodospirillaceae bacterium TMED8]
MPSSQKTLKIVLASPRGFCAGVERAIEIVERALDRYGPPVYVRHEIVHNEHVVNSLRAKGAIFVEEVDDIPEGAHAIFSAHGVAASVVDAADERQLKVVDATCPLVSKVHKEGQNHVKKGRQVILIGHDGHPEVEGTRGQIPGGVLLVNTPTDVKSLDVDDTIELSYVTQTTLSVDDTREVIEALKSRFPKIVGPDVKDICYATQNRQDAVRKLAPSVDILLVVGAQNSSNSNRLRDLGTSIGKPSYLIADATDLEPSWLQGVAAVGLTAGASAPEGLVQGVIERLSELRDVQVERLVELQENVTFKLPTELLKPSENISRME